MAELDIGVTYRGSVDAWECDQMEHMNVRFFGRRFSEAEVHAFAALRMAPSTRPSRDVLRFRREVRRGAALRIVTRRPESGVASLVHDLYEDKADTPSATLEVDYHVGATGLDDDDAGDRIECGRGLVRAADCLDGHMAREGLLRLVNHANIYFGIGRHRAQHPDGRLAVGTAIVACAMRYRAPTPVGTPFVVQTRLGGEGERSFRLIHCVRHATDGTVLADCDATIVFFDMATRRAIPLPDRFRDEFSTAKGRQDG